MNDRPIEDLPIACDLDPARLEARRATLLADLVRQSTRSEPSADGWRLEFQHSPDTLASIIAAIEAERRCCRFLRFELCFEQNLGPLIVEMRGPAGTREFLAALFDAPR